MSCPLETTETGSALLDYCAGRLPATDAALIDQHLALCASCRRLVRDQHTVWEALESWNEVVISPDFNRRVYSGVAAERRCSPLVRWTRMLAARWSLARACWFRAG